MTSGHSPAASGTAGAGIEGGGVLVLELHSGTSTERVRQYRRGQREAKRKLIRFYLDAGALLSRSSCHQELNGRLAEELLTGASNR